MKNKVGAALYSTIDDVATENDKMVNGPPILIANDPTTGVVGEIDAATNTWWRNQVMTNNGDAMIPEKLLQFMDLLFMNCIRDKDMPTVIIMDKKYFNLYKQACMSNQYGNSRWRL